MSSPRSKWTCLSCICLLLLANCVRVTPTPLPVTITFAYPPFDGDRSSYQALAERFHERHPHITVDPQQWVPWQSANAIDVDVFAVFGEFVWLMREQESIVALDAFIQQDKSFDPDDLHPSAAPYFRREGSWWAIPGEINVDVIYYNRDLFDQYGVPYPEFGWTWVEFFEKAVALTDPDAGVYGYASAGPDLDVISFIYQHGGRVVDDLHEPTRTMFNDPLTVEALEWYARLVHEYKAVLTPVRAYSEYAVDAPSVGIVTDKVGMWMDSFSGTREIKDNVNWGMVPLPRDSQSFTQASINGYAISSQASAPDACWQWISFLSREARAGPIPVRRSVLESEAYEQRVGREAADVAMASLDEAEIISYWTLFTEFRNEMGIFNRAIDRIVRGDDTAQEAMDWAQRTAEK